MSYGLNIINTSGSTVISDSTSLLRVRQAFTVSGGSPTIFGMLTVLGSGNLCADGQLFERNSVVGYRTTNTASNTVHIQNGVGTIGVSYSQVQNRTTMALPDQKEYKVVSSGVVPWSTGGSYGFKVYNSSGSLIFNGDDPLFVIIQTFKILVSFNTPETYFYFNYPQTSNTGEVYLIPGGATYGILSQGSQYRSTSIYEVNFGPTSGYIRYLPGAIYSGTLGWPSTKLFTISLGVLSS